MEDDCCFLSAHHTVNLYLIGHLGCRCGRTFLLAEFSHLWEKDARVNNGHEEHRDEDHPGFCQYCE